MSNVGDALGLSWKLDLAQMNASMVKRNMFDTFYGARYYAPNEVGILHPENKSYVRIVDDGDINAFVSTACGINIDRESESVNIISDTSNLVSRYVNIYTTPTGLAWNGYYINPTLYTKIGRGIPKEDRNIRLNVTYEVWDDYYQVYRPIQTTMPLFIKKPVTNTYNEDINQLIRDLNIPL